MQTATNNFMQMSHMADEVANSSSGLNQSVTAMSALGMSMNMVGDQFVSAGSTIISTLGTVISKVTETGTTMLTARTQLNQLYGSVAEGEKTLQRISSYAKDSIFNFEDLIPSVVMLKANGIEAFDEITSSTGKSKAMLMDYAADLAAFNPQMRNAYGTGIQAAMGALNEYIAEGNEISLKRGASLDITNLLGEDKGKTIEERSRQVADLMEKLDMVGTVSNLAGTPMQRLSNASDVLFQFISKISDSGVFDKFTELVATFTDYVFAIPDDEMNNIAQNISDSLSIILDGLVSLVKWGLKAVDFVRAMYKEHPNVMKLVGVVTALSGGLIVLTGVALKLGGSFLTLLASFKYLTGGIYGSNVFAFLKTGILSVIKTAIPLIALGSILYTVWKNNMFGVQEVVKTNIEKVVGFFRSLADAWDGNMTEDNYKNMQKMGFEPLINNILMFKYYWKSFCEGFSVGFKKAVESFMGSIVKIADKLKMFGIDTDGLKDKMTNLLEAGKENDWESIGEAVGEFVANMLIIVGVISVLGKAVKIIMTIVGGLRTVFSFFGKIKSIVLSIYGWLSNLGVSFAPIISALETAYIKFLYFIDAIKNLGGSAQGILQVLGNIGQKLVSALTKPKQLILWILGAIGKLVIAVAGALGFVISLPAEIVGAIVVAVVALVTCIRVFKDEIMNFCANLPSMIGKAFDWVKEKVNAVFDWLISKLGDVPIIGGILKGLKVLFNWIINGMKITVQTVSFILATVVQIVTGVVNVIIDVVWGIIQVVWSVIKAIGKAIWSVLKVVGKVFQLIYQVIRVIFLSIVLVVKTIIEKIVGVFRGLYNRVKPIFQRIGNFFVNIWQKAKEKLQPHIDSIRNLFSTVSEKISGFFETCGDAITNKFNTVKSVIESIVNWITDKIEAISSTVSSITDKAGNLVGGAVDSVKGIGDKLASLVGLDTGGYVKSEGVALLHPNEVVVNSGTTKELQEYLSDNKKKKASGVKGISKVPTTNNSSNHVDKSKTDNSIKLGKGAIQIVCKNAMSTKEVNAMVDKMYKALERKQQKKKMARTDKSKSKVVFDS